MGKAYLYNVIKNSNETFRGWADRPDLRLAFSGKLEKSYFEDMGGRMKLFLIMTTIFCFTVGTVTGCSVHTLVDMRNENHALEAKYVTMSLRKLSEVKI